MKRARNVFAAGLAVVAIAAAGCGGDDDSSEGSVSVAPADVESASGEIQILGWSFNEAPDQQDAESVTAKWSYPATGPDLITRARTGSFDIIASESAAMPALESLDIFAPIDTSLIANYDQVIPELREEFMSENGDVIGIPFSVGPWMTAYDSSEVPEPRTLDDLLKPVYRDSIAPQDDPLLIGTIAMEQGVEDMSEMTHEDLDRVMAFLEELRPNIRTFFRIGEDVQLFNSGSIAVSLGSFGTILGKAMENNPAIKTNFLATGSFVNAWSLARDDNAAAAINWINRTLTAPGQEAIVEASAYYPALPEALPAFKDLEDPVSDVLAEIPLPQLLEEAPVLRGYAPEGEGDIVSIDEVIRAWDEYKASF